jgi:hypothetical protein
MHTAKKPKQKKRQRLMHTDLQRLKSVALHPSERPNRHHVLQLLVGVGVPHSRVDVLPGDPAEEYARAHVSL